jgi:cell wall assembly regulator SMI1
VDFLIKIGIGMNINKFKYFIITLLIATYTCIASDLDTRIKNKGEEKVINSVWKEYFTYWRNKDKKLQINRGDKLEEIIEFEKEINIKLPKEFKKSLSSQFHFSRDGNNGLRYSWFGDLIEINFLSIKKIKKEYEVSLEEIEINVDNLTNVYMGNITPYKEKGWSKYWIPIIVRYDVNIIVFLDLRTNLDSNEYAQLLVINPYIETERDGWHNRIAFVSNSYTSFMQEALEYMSVHGGLDNNYFLTKLNLPLSYWD